MTAKIGALLAVAAVAAATAAAAAWAKSKNEEAELDLEVADAPARGAVPAPVAPVEPSSANAAEAAPAAATGSQDDLTTLRGIGAVRAERLAGVGVTSFAQIAAWSDDDIAAIGQQINVSPGRIKREDWVGQAAAALGS
jgi:predicted flap endonuclease-1-like 5' DNA nuclease